MKAQRAAAGTAFRDLIFDLIFNLLLLRGAPTAVSRLVFRLGRRRIADYAASVRVRETVADLLSLATRAVASLTSSE